MATTGRTRRNITEKSQHTLVTTVHLLVNQPLAEQRLGEQNFHNKHKIFVHRINALPKYRDFFDYVNDRLQNQLVVIMNMDIYTVLAKDLK